MSFLVFDIEANGLLNEVTEVWCAVTKSNEGLREYGPDDITQFTRDLAGCANDTILVAHNCIEYDLQVLEKLYGYRHRGRVLDTLVLSRLLQPERQGGHGLGPWGERLGRAKPEHEEWDRYSPEMLHRCREDVLINELVLNHLLKEGGISEKELDALIEY